MADEEKSGFVDLTKIEAPVFRYRRKAIDGSPIDVTIDLFELAERIGGLVAPVNKETGRPDGAALYDLMRKAFGAPTLDEAKANGVNTLERHELERLLAVAQEQINEVPDRKRFFVALRKFRESIA